MANATPFDITALINLQSHYINDLADYYGVTNSNPANPSALKSNLVALSSSISGATAQIGNVLSIQSSVNGILNDEKTRLEQKKTAVENDINNQKRLIEINDSMQKKQSAYNQIYVIVVAVLVIFVIATKLNSMGLLPEMIFATLIILTFSIAGIVIYIKLRKIWQRDNLYFDKLDLKPPPNASAADNANAIAGASESGDLSQIASMSNACSGQSCCSAGTVWESKVNSCVPSCPSGNIWSVSGNTCIIANTCVTGNICGNICNNGNTKLTCKEAFSGLNKIEPFDGLFVIPSGLVR